MHQSSYNRASLPSSTLPCLFLLRPISCLLMLTFIQLVASVLPLVSLLFPSLCHLCNYSSTSLMKMECTSGNAGPKNGPLGVSYFILVRITKVTLKLKFKFKLMPKSRQASGFVFGCNSQVGALNKKQHWTLNVRMVGGGDEDNEFCLASSSLFSPKAVSLWPATRRLLNSYNSSSGPSLCENPAQTHTIMRCDVSGCKWSAVGKRAHSKARRLLWNCCFDA